MWRSLIAVVLCLLASNSRAQLVLPQSDAVFSFDHVLSIYEWHGLFDYVTRPSDIPTLSPLFDIHLRGNSRFLTLDSLTTTDAAGIITALQPLATYDNTSWSIAPFATFAGNSYVTTPRPGKAVGSLITKQASGYGIGGLRLTSPDRSFISAGVGLARETQSAFSSGISSNVSGLTPVTATGLMLASADSLSLQTLSEGLLANASARADERFFKTRDERYSNDSLRLMLLSGTGDPTSAQNAGYLQLALLRRDFFFSPDSVTSLKQERTEYSFLLSDSLAYPITQDLLRAHVAFEIEPREISRTTDAAAASYIASGFSTFSTLMAPSNVSSLRILAQAAMTAGEETGALRQWSGNARMRYEERSETISLAQDELSNVEAGILHKLEETLSEASYSSRTTSFDATLRYAPNVRSRTELQGATRLLSYDTPSDLNHDNRDDLVTSLTLRHHYDFSDHLRFDGSLRASRDHLVYLKSDRSAQNAVTQSLIFGSLGTYASRAIYASAGGEVFANYTLFDYAKILPALSTIGNYVIRGMTLSDTIAFPVTTIANDAILISLEQGCALRVSERGSYSDSVFAERRETQVTEGGASIFVGISSNYITAVPWTVRIGARGFVTSHSGRSSSVNSGFGELERQTRVGPAMTVTIGRMYLTGPSLQASVWYPWNSSRQFASSTFGRAILQPESYLTAAWTF
jgi:hypothetical protein